MIRKVVVSQYNLEWDTAFEEIKEQLKKVFLGIKIEFSHIGSTSIPGCSAKPIVDILGTTPDVLEIDAFNQAMSSIGFKAFGEYGMKQSLWLCSLDLILQLLMKRRMTQQSAAWKE